ncbi:Adenosylmethionine-8-amino-7-oxononanoate aminotransferase,adenosylmethionine--8-amino-7-oxononanoatetransaminase,Ornithine/acetylornithine aminotransferase,adenosylmethionine-8-amino-7-oxononanoate transaminase,Aminotransferase class-III [Chlamydia serpentis]|uniref:Adenosylmethionine-8-amino-7-oxononanoate aminotransferase n=1 Tax=Chlamydia serpentis TaxID=1967782 RepID=A0A2R8FCJ8_9CHLA|nr:adenosylmethionine--8-amino-7-oxononanoate transaminase [Chlamydia serpentis]SPN74145.1 Adenosylmethionine-8-amino-7-oxononanoate aminotransferase,adenosylmethionine--8-amino-7-oxononanoatetransaminase,Ornithine/acetylornithine aminotransferase,adenosylmethionine-8-amino-7-oxononanoate transaminase,Aminotransferase class-III [Chlamydia serpentis]
MNKQSTKNQGFIWHPFIQSTFEPDPIRIVRGEGAYLYTESGEKYLDAISSWWCNLHGHGHPYITEKLCEQAHKLEHVIFANFTHAPALDLVSKLTPLLPKGLQHFFFSDNGATSIEIAIKIALQYYHNQGKSKTHFVGFSNAYHGDTFGAMSVAGQTPTTTPFHNLFFPCSIISAPYYGKEELAIAQAKKVFSQGNIAAFIYEPILQGTAGMIVYNPEGLQEILKLAKHYGIICIADEILTGFGRTGPLFASEYTPEIAPDIICLSKGLTGGYLPLALTVTTEEIHKAFVSKDRMKAMLHGHTFAGNPLGCSVALASLELTISPECLKQRQMIERCHYEFQKAHGSLWQRCQVLGTVLAVDYPTEATGYFSQYTDQINHFFLERGILISISGNTLYLVPPYCIQEKELYSIYSYLQDALCLQPQ